MTDNFLPEPQLIETDAELHRTVKSLRSQPKIAVDTESNSLFAYKEQVCLIQISTPETDYLIDSLSATDLKPLKTIMGDRRIEKVFHAAEYDIICLKRDFGFDIKNIFDTRVAMRTLGLERTGLGNVLQDQFGVGVNKKWQRANWGQRPLPSELLNYARMDTHYLLPLRDRLAKRLKQEDRWEEAKEEWERISSYQPSENDFDPDRYWRISGARKLKPKQVSVLRQIFLFREEQAQRLNRPPFKVIGDKTLMEIAREMPTSKDALAKLHGMTSGQMRRYANGLLESIETGISVDPPSQPKSERVEEATANRYKKLHTWRKKKARARKVESDVILPRDIVWDISHANPETLDELHQIMKPMNWRFRTYGQEILQILKS